MPPVNRTVQYFSEDDLRRGESLSPDEIVAFLEDFRITFGPTSTDDLPLGWFEPESPGRSGAKSETEGRPLAAK